jgi:hypothetical protein
MYSGYLKFRFDDNFNKQTSFLLACNLKIHHLKKMFCSRRLQMFKLQSIMGNYVSFLVELLMIFFRQMRTNPTTILTIYEHLWISLAIFNYIYTLLMIYRLITGLDMYILVWSESSVAYGYICGESIKVLLSVAVIVSGTCRMHQIEGESLNIVKALICTAVLIEILGTL